MFYQPDVYQRTAEIARRVGAHRIIDIGCGDGEKLVALHPEFDVMGIDYRENLAQCRNNHDAGTWLEHDIESDDPLPVEDFHGAVVVCADVIEHLVRPERLLAKVRAALSTCSAVVMSTPERNLRRGVHHAGPPPNLAHVREWSITEFRALLAAEGFIGSVSLTRSNDRSPVCNTILAELFASKDVRDHRDPERFQVSRWPVTLGVGDDVGVPGPPGEEAGEVTTDGPERQGFNRPSTPSRIRHSMSGYSYRAGDYGHSG